MRMVALIAGYLLVPFLIGLRELTIIPALLYIPAVAAFYVLGGRPAGILTRWNPTILAALFGVKVVQIAVPISLSYALGRYLG